VGRFRISEKRWTVMAKNVVEKESSDALKEVKTKYMSRSVSNNTCTMLSCERVDPKTDNV